MRGEFVGVWSETWRGIWSPLAKNSDAPTELLSDLYRELVSEPEKPITPPPATQFSDLGDLIRQEDIERRTAYEIALRRYSIALARYEEAVNGGPGTRAAFRTALIHVVKTEATAKITLERGYNVIEDYGIDRLTNFYFLSAERFIEKYSLRYDLRRPFTIHPTLPGLFTSLIRELKNATGRDAALHPLMLEFEEALRDLRSDRSSGKIKSCIQKQINLLEAIGQRSPGVTTNTLGRICDQVGTWPHDKVKDAMKNLYGFACDYPGIRHGGTSINQTREISMKDLISMSVVLAGFAPYLTDLVSSEIVYHGG